MKGWMQISLTVGLAVVAFLFVLTIFLLWKVRSVRKKKKLSKDLQKSQRVLLDQKNNELLSRLSNSNIREHNYVQVDPHIRNNKISPKLQFPHLEVLKYQDSSQSDSDGEIEPILRPKSDREWLEMENSSPELPNRSRETPSIEFSLVHVSSNKTLTVHIIRVANLPLRYRKNCSSFVKVSFLARKKSSHQTQVFKKSLNPEYVQNFTFPGYSLEEIKRFTLRLSVFVKHYRLLKNKLVGEIWFPLSGCDLKADAPVIISEYLSINRNRSTKQKRAKISNLGQLFLLLQYQANANRLKVLIRKAENLPGTTGVSIGQPEYYVIVSLLRDVEGITYKETRPATGVSPIWNQPFLFDVPSDKINEYWLQFLIMKGRIYSRDGVVGHVIVGPGTTLSGEAHWNEAMEPKALDTAKWHNVRPVDDF